MVPKVVLTGGPCAGKTSCVRAIRERFGEQIVTVPETATLVLGSGFPPPGHERIPCPPDEWIQAFQGTILSIQQEVEASFERLARNCGVRLLVCDRGVLDGAAYWPGGREAFLRHFGQSLEDCFAATGASCIWNRWRCRTRTCTARRATPSATNVWPTRCGSSGRCGPPGRDIRVGPSWRGMWICKSRWAGCSNTSRACFRLPAVGYRLSANTEGRQLIADSWLPSWGARR